MAARLNLLDAVIQHRIDLHSHANHQAKQIIRMLSAEDRRLVTMLRERLPHIAAGEIAAPRIKAILGAVRDMRREGWSAIHGQVRDDLIALAKSEGAMVERIALASIAAPVVFNPIRAATLRAAVTKDPFAGGRNASHTLSQWFGKLAANDQQRLRGAVQLGVNRFEPVGTIVQRIAGTRELDYTDGILAISRREAETAVRTSIVHVANAAHVAWGEANSDVVTGMQWTSMLDDRLCEECADLDGQVTDDTPPAHPNCRCTLVPVFDLERLSGRIPDQIGGDEQEQEAA